MTTHEQALTIICPVCNAMPGRACTQPTDTSRKPVPWVHLPREFAWQQANPQDFFLTFGIEYREKPHPYWPECDPSGWVRVTAPTFESALDKVKARFGLEWSQLYPEPNFDRAKFPAGELMALP